MSEYRLYTQETAVYIVAWHTWILLLPWVHPVSPMHMYIIKHIWSCILYDKWCITSWAYELARNLNFLNNICTADIVHEVATKMTYDWYNWSSFLLYRDILTIRTTQALEILGYITLRSQIIYRSIYRAYSPISTSPYFLCTIFGWLHAWCLISCMGLWHERMQHACNETWLV